MHRLLTCCCLFLALGAPSARAVGGALDRGAKSPQASLAAMVPRPGFTVELVAAEPLVQSPIAFDWGPDGKLWVVEMIDYPLGIDNKGKPGGRVCVLEDTDGDGRYDRSTVFLDGLLHPTGVMAWRKGVLVTCAPEIFYAEDTDGDGKADRREVLFTGFGEVNPQHRVNGLRWGLDNWIYCANGDFAQIRTRPVAGAAGPAARGITFNKQDDVRRLVQSGARIQSIKTGAVFDIRNRDFRIRPDEGLLDPQAGQSQYGRDCDNWGNWFGCNNSVPMWHFVLDDDSIRRNAYVAGPNPRVESPRSRTFPRGAIGRETGTARTGGGNAFTSACGIAIYRDDLFGREFEDNWFICEPVHNLVHREVLVPVGATFTSHRADDEHESEFLSSTDTWFSPVMVRTGPDGALWIADMYRQVLEHPNWMPRGWEHKVDVRAGAERGRIYRVYPTTRKPRPILPLNRLDTAGLVAALDSPSGWQRDTAQQLLIQRRDKSALALLEKQALNSPQPLCRLHSLCALDGCDALQAGTLRRVLADRDAGVQRQAVRLCDSRLSKFPDLGADLIKLIGHADASVRLQVAYTLGEWDDPRAGRALGELLLRDAKDPYISAAAMSSVNAQNVDRVVQTVTASRGSGPLPGHLLENLLRSAVGFGSRTAPAILLSDVALAQDGRYARWQFEALARFLDVLDQRNETLAKLRDEGGPGLTDALKQVALLLSVARARASDPHAKQQDRLAALRLLGRGPDHQEEDLAAMSAFLAPQNPPTLQSAAVDALGALRDPRVADVLLKEWKAYSPEMRSQVLDVLTRRAEWLEALLAAIEHRAILASEIDAIRRQRLLEQKSIEIRNRASRLLSGEFNPERQAVIDSIRTAVSPNSDASRGSLVFAKRCASCHRLGTVGHAVGPDLAMVRDKSPEWLLTAILNPNQAIESKYVNYIAVARNGVTSTGILANESGNSITLLGPDGKRQVILRSDLEELSSSGKSLMPEGLEKDLKPRDFADLIAFLRARLPARGR